MKSDEKDPHLKIWDIYPIKIATRSKVLISQTILFITVTLDFWQPKYITWVVGNWMFTSDCRNCIFLHIFCAWHIVKCRRMMDAMSYQIFLLYLSSVNIHWKESFSQNWIKPIIENNNNRIIHILLRWVNQYTLSYIKNIYGNT